MIEIVCKRKLFELDFTSETQENEDDPKKAKSELVSTSETQEKFPKNPQITESISDSDMEDDIYCRDKRGGILIISPDNLG